jgi:hypothetical protein
LLGWSNHDYHSYHPITTHFTTTSTLLYYHFYHFFSRVHKKSKLFLHSSICFHDPEKGGKSVNSVEESGGKHWWYYHSRDGNRIGGILIAQLCSICSHPRRQDIEKAIVAGESNRRVASQFDLSEAAVRRHKKGGHLPGKLVKAAAAKERRDAQELLDLMDDLLTEAKGVVKDAKKSKDPRTLLLGIREGRETASRLLELTLVADIEKRLHDLETGEGPENLTGE